MILNRLPDHGQSLEAVDAESLGLAAAEEAEGFFVGHPAYAPTPLHALPALAAELGVGALHLKDEGARLGLGSFKALGGAYAVVRVAQEEAERQPDRPAVAEGMIFACASAGNHGRSVAFGARLVGAKAVVFLHTGVSEERAAAIERLGARTSRVEGSYDDAVAEATRVAEAEGWTLVSDTSWPGYERVPGMVMQGYTVLVREALRQLPSPPTHVFVQAGVGGVAAAVAGHLATALGDRRPFFVVVDPSRAACFYESAKAGRPVEVARGEPTVMAMLECYEPSRVAWRVLSRVADAFMTVDDDDAVHAMRRLARPVGGDPAVVAGESGAAGVAGLLRAAAAPDVAAVLGLNGGSRVLAIVTEGATDPERYAGLVGLPPSGVVVSSGA